MRLESGWQGVVIVIICGGKTLVPVEYPEVGKVRAGAPPSVMKRPRSWGDRDLLGSNTEDTDNSEQDESTSLRSSWSLVSHNDRSLGQSQLEHEYLLHLYCLVWQVA